MNLSALPELLLTWLKNRGIELLQPARGQGAEAPAFKPGQQYAAQVLEPLANGRSLVRVGKEVLDMALPGQHARPGTTLHLTYVTSSPRPTFMLAQAAGSAQVVRLSGTAQQVAALIRYAQSTSVLATGATDAAARANNMPAISTAATSAPAFQPTAGLNFSGQRPIVTDVRLLLQPATPVASLSAAVASRSALPALTMAGQPMDGLHAALAPNTQLATQGVAQATLAGQAVLPQRLRQVVRESGLFYESHLGRWVRGQWSLDSILREPQARLAAADALATGLPELGRMPEAAARLAGHQLMMLEGAPFLWQGIAWPGQMLQWQIEERDGTHAQGEEEGGWRTELKLVLPRLGLVQAALVLSPQGLRLYITAGEQSAADELRAALPRLAQRLEQAGLKVLSMQVEEGSDEAAAA